MTGVDRDEYKVRSVLNGRAPFFEPGLEGLVRDNVAVGRLRATTSLAEAIADADIALVCVGTPSEKNGNLSLDQLERVISEIAGLLDSRTKPLVVAIRSTVFPGTCEQVVITALGTRAAVVSNPEFLREGAAVRDFMEPSLVVVGGTDREAVQRVAKLYEPLGVTPCLVSLRTAEMIKYACNAFHALKIAFANEIGAFSTNLEVDGHEVMNTVCEDVKLNVSPAYMKPGFAFGGSCLPKDLRALVYRAGRLDLGCRCSNPCCRATTNIWRELLLPYWSCQLSVSVSSDWPSKKIPMIFGKVPSFRCSNNSSAKGATCASLIRISGSMRSMAAIATSF